MHNSIIQKKTEKNFTSEEYREKQASRKKYISRQDKLFFDNTMDEIIGQVRKKGYKEICKRLIKKMGEKRYFEIAQKTDGDETALYYQILITRYLDNKYEFNRELKKYVLIKKPDQKVLDLKEHIETLEAYYKPHVVAFSNKTNTDCRFIEDKIKKAFPHEVIGTLSSRDIILVFFRNKEDMLYFWQNIPMKNIIKSPKHSDD